MRTWVLHLHPAQRPLRWAVKAPTARDAWDSHFHTALPKRYADEYEFDTIQWSFGPDRPDQGLIVIHNGKIVAEISDIRTKTKECMEWAMG